MMEAAPALLFIAAAAARVAVVVVGRPLVLNPFLAGGVGDALAREGLVSVGLPPPRPTTVAELFPALTFRPAAAEEEELVVVGRVLLGGLPLPETGEEPLCC